MAPCARDPHGFHGTLHEGKHWRKEGDALGGSERQKGPGCGRPAAGGAGAAPSPEQGRQGAFVFVRERAFGRARSRCARNTAAVSSGLEPTLGRTEVFGRGSPEPRRPPAAGLPSERVGSRGGPAFVPADNSAISELPALHDDGGFRQAYHRVRGKRLPESGDLESDADYWPRVLGGGPSAADYSKEDAESFRPR